MLPTSQRLIFRCWSESDVALAKELWGDREVTKLIASEPIDAEARLRTEIELQKNRGIQYWPMFDRETVRFVGAAGLHPRQQEEKIYELGFHICREAWGKGYAMEAAHSVIAFAFKILKAESLFAGHNPTNAASSKILTKLGFTHTHDELYAPTGLMHPSYSLSR